QRPTQVDQERDDQCARIKQRWACNHAGVVRRFIHGSTTGDSSLTTTNDIGGLRHLRPSCRTVYPEHCRLRHWWARFFNAQERAPMSASIDRQGGDSMSGFTRALLFAAMGASIIAGAAFADTNDKKIAFSNNYAGNSWRQAMLKSYDIVT